MWDTSAIPCRYENLVGPIDKSPPAQPLSLTHGLSRGLPSPNPSAAPHRKDANPGAAAGAAVGAAASAAVGAAASAANLSPTAPLVSQISPRR
jgi:hypothetical protein